MHPILFNIGSFPVHSFGVMVLLGFMLGLAYAVSQARKQQVAAEPVPKGAPRLATVEDVFDLSVGALFVGIIGARILYILLDLQEFRANPADIFKIWTGGISIHGAIVSSALYLWWFCRNRNIAFLSFADLAAPAFSLGYAIGRIGCFLNGCCYGHACDLPWAVRFLKDGHEGVYTVPSHPAQLYATLMGLVMFAILHFWRKRPHRDGEIMLGFFGLYCIYRFIDEEFRKGATAEIFVAGLTHAQVFSLAMLPIIAYFLFRLRRQPRSQPANRTTAETV